MSIFLFKRTSFQNASSSVSFQSKEIRIRRVKVFSFRLALPSNDSYRSRIATGQNLDDFRRVVEELQAKYEPIHEGLVQYHPEILPTDPEISIETYNLSLPPWLCQSYIRLPPEEHKQKLEEAQRRAEDPNREKRLFYDVDGNEISRKKMKKLRRLSRRPGKNGKMQQHDRSSRKSFDPCVICKNPVGLRCTFSMCKPCCRNYFFENNKECEGHKIFKKR